MHLSRFVGRFSCLNIEKAQFATESHPIHQILFPLISEILYRTDSYCILVVFSDYIVFIRPFFSESHEKKSQNGVRFTS